MQFSCANKNLSEDDLTQFTNIENSGIDFINKLNPTLSLSAFDYVYFQNGGGVAVADFDQDGLEDLFFTSNLQSDRLYKNLGNFKFEDITPSADVDGFKKGITNSWSTGVTITDINQDGFPDIYICKSGNHPRGKINANLLYVNNQDLTFTERAKEYGIDDINHSTQATFFDYDKDGDLDLFVLNHSPVFGKPDIAFQMNNFPQTLKPFSNSFYINENGHFRDATQESGLLSYSYGLGVVASDFNKDGWIDLYTTNDFTRPDKLFINTGEGGFQEKLKGNVGHISQFSMGCDAADINNDGRIDISIVDMAPANNYRSKTQMPSMSTEDFKTYTEDYNYIPQYSYNSLLLNMGDEKYAEIAKLAGVSKTDWSWSSLLADFDNDGWKDEFVTNGYKYNRMENDFALRFDSMMKSCDYNPSESKRKKWMTMPPSYKLSNYMWQNQKELQFKNVSKQWGFDEPSFSNGAAYADLDNDGDLDIVINNIDDPASIYRNNTNQNYLQIALKNNGRTDLSTTLNSQLTIYHHGVQDFQELTLTRGFQSASTSKIHFGLGTSLKIDSLIFYNPNFGYSIIKDVEANQLLTLDISQMKFQSEPFFEKNKEMLFKKSNPSGLRFAHRENEYDDFEKELLLPHQNSKHGPFISKGDINGDGLDDVFIGGAHKQPAVLFIQNGDGTFVKTNTKLWETEAKYEDIGSLFFDFDNDLDLDLYVVSGGNEWEENDAQYVDRLYLNDGKGNFSRSTNAVPEIRSSGSKVVPLTNKDDGVNYLFVAGRMKPQQYPYPSNSSLLKISNGKCIDISRNQEKILSNLGIVTCATSSDINKDGNQELIVAGEWMHPMIFSLADDKLQEITPEIFKENVGWWNSIKAVDLDKDGDMDLIAGNLGLNYKYTASLEEPFNIYANDFDSSGDLDIVLSYNSHGEEYPVRGRECSSEEMPNLLQKFPTYDAFGSATLNEIYKNKLKESLHFSATEFSSCIFWNEGDLGFKKEALPIEAQFSSVNSILTLDYNQDGHLDLLLGGNFYVSEIETPRNDASYGCLLLGDGNGHFQFLPNSVHRMFIGYDVKSMERIRTNKNDYFLVGNNNDSLLIYQLENR